VTLVRSFPFNYVNIYWAFVFLWSFGWGVDILILVVYAGAARVLYTYGRIVKENKSGIYISWRVGTYIF